MASFREIAEQNIFPGESGGDYNALFGYSNREGGRYGGTRLTDMTVNQALDFSQPSGDYGQWVKGQVGRVATPMGAYQVVGTTLRAAQQGLGLTGNERMDEGLQDRIGEWIYQNQGPGAWEGWRGNTQARASTNNAQPPSTRNAPTGGILSNEGNQMAQPQQPQRPQGLLGSLGIQRRDPNAQGETSQPFYNRQSFGDTLARMAPALGRMGVMGLEGPMQAQLDTRNQRQSDERAQAMQAEQKNATAEWLRSQGAGQLADGVMSGALTGAQAMSQMQAQAAAAASAPMNAIELETAQAELDQLRTPPPDLEGEAKLRGEFTSLPIVKSFSAQSTAYGRVLASVNDPTPAGDLALIFNFMKVLDPGSTVREGEFATAAQSGGVDDRVRALYNQVVEGTRLSDPQRDDFANRATRLYSNAEQQYKGIADQYSAFAVQSGFDPATMMPDFTYSGDRYQTPMALTPPQLTGAQLVQMGLSAQEWQDTWATFTDQERQEFLGAN
jgi:hypothetical protein